MQPFVSKWLTECIERVKQSNGIKSTRRVYTELTHRRSNVAVDTNGPIAEEWRRNKATQEANDEMQPIEKLRRDRLVVERSVEKKKLLTLHGANNHPQRLWLFDEVYASAPNSMTTIVQSINKRLYF